MRLLQVRPCHTTPEPKRFHLRRASCMCRNTHVACVEKRLLKNACDLGGPLLQSTVWFRPTHAWTACWLPSSMTATARRACCTSIPVVTCPGTDSHAAWMQPAMALLEDAASESHTAPCARLARHDRARFCERMSGAAGGSALGPASPLKPCQTLRRFAGSGRSRAAAVNTTDVAFKR